MKKKLATEGPRLLQALNAVRLAVSADPFWAERLSGLSGVAAVEFSVHLAVFVEPFLGYILDGSKTVESRFSANRCAPFGRVHQGDAVLLKRAGGPVVGLAHVRAVWSYHLDEASWRFIRENFTEALRAQDPGFWKSRREAAYATLMSINHVIAFEPIEWEKRDRRGWVVVQKTRQPFLFGGGNEP
jgi:hypothetical protein